MKIWDKIAQVDIKNKERYVKAFSEIVEQIKDNQYNFKEGIEEKVDYYLVNERDRLNSFFVHIVPKEAFNLFKEIQEQTSDEFLGFSVLVGKRKGKDVRVSCFGIPCNLLARSLTKV